ncbi:MAG: ABC transporter permease [Oscillospiraceae bacterium]|nr:ABC transporter permease [Oscillospiraceae bacterium]
MLGNIQQAFQGIWHHKLRSILTMLGIIIGIAAIITIVSTIKGTNDQIKENLIGSGNNAVVVSLHQGDSQLDLSWQKPEGIRVITEETRRELEKLEGVSLVSLFRQREWSDGVYYKDSSFNGCAMGVDDSYFRIYGYRVCYGRGFLPEDRSARRKVVILDANAASSIFYGENPVGKVLEISGEPFTVIGVVERSVQFRPVIETMEDYYLYADKSRGTIFLTEAGWDIAYGYDEPQNAAVKAVSTDAMTTAGKAVADKLTASQIQNPRNSDYSYQSEDLLQQAEQLQSMSESTNNLLIWIAAISLLVGGIGVMNIMLVSVSERTHEIGLKKALGAKRRRILGQFLTEAAVLTSLGGLLGILGGIGLAELLSKAMDTPTAISVPAIIVAAAFSILIGLIFGLLPATKAARMNPIDALRRE